MWVIYEFVHFSTPDMSILIHETIKLLSSEREIKETKILAEIERMESRDTDQIKNTDTHNKIYKINKIIHVHTKQRQ